MEPLTEHQRDRLLYFLKDDKWALLYCIDLLYIAHLWDDLLDGDKELTGEDINQAFIKCLASIPNNPFYQAMEPALKPMMFNAMSMWLESNELRNGSESQRLTALHLQNGILDVIHFCIVAKGTVDWAREVAAEFWDLFGISRDELEECVGPVVMGKFPVTSVGEHNG